MFYCQVTPVVITFMYRSETLMENLKVLKKKEAEETAALENMVQMVEKNLKLTTVWQTGNS
jgi:hypothetical protein